MGDPALIILDRLTESGHAGLTESLIGACSFVRGRGTAVVWIADFMNEATITKLSPTVDLSLTETATVAH
jgi:hypothetical protein